MTDRLERALRAAREQHTGEHPRSEETLQRILSDNLKARRARGRTFRVLLPIAAAMAFSTAALARWASPGWIRGMLAPTDQTAARPSAPPPPDAARGTLGVVAPTTTEVTASAAPEAFEDAPPPPEALTSTETAPEKAPRPSAPLAVPARPAVAAPADLPSRAEASASSPTPDDSAPGSEGDVYAYAHRLHFDGHDPAAARAAWDEYLRRYPAGRFAPDAQYNRAIDLLKLRRYDEARAALQPFADGAFGGYHRDDARELLRSIP